MDVNDYLVTIPLYDKIIHVVLSEDMEVNKQYLVDEYGDLGFDIGNSVGYTCTLLVDGERVRYLLIDLNQDNYELLNGAVAHECLHISWDICNELGIKLQHDNHEAQAYILGYLCKEVYKKISKRFGNVGDE